MNNHYLDLLLSDCKQYMQSNSRNLFTMCSILSLYESIHLRDPMTALHSMRVASYSYLLAKHMDPSRAFEYFIGGLTHDVGKIAFPDSILLSSRKIGTYEKEKIRKHVKDSFEILKKLQLPTVILNIGRFHHERFNGSGYLEGLKGNQIPFEARVAAVADVYSAITDEGRKYRKRLSYRGYV